jgi:calcineurin-like phosphoesterase family protein
MERASIWFTGNWRLGDPAAVAARPDVSSPAEMATVLIEEFNSLVEPGDIVWMLGGMFGDAQAGIEPDLDAVGLLHGRKYLIAGPGDHCWFAHPGSMTWTQRYRDAGLAGVVTGEDGS